MITANARVVYALDAGVERGGKMIEAASAIGMRRRDLLKYSVLGGAAAFLAACSNGGDSGDSSSSSDPKTQILNAFAAGTWDVTVNYPSDDDYDGPSITTVEILPNGTFTVANDSVNGATPLPGVPKQGTWALVGGQLQVVATGDGPNRSGTGSGLPPEPISGDVPIAWSWTAPGTESGQPNATQKQVAAVWDESRKALTLTTTTATSVPMTIRAVKI